MVVAPAIPPTVRLVLLAAAAALLPACNRDGRPGRLVLPTDGGVHEAPLDPALRLLVTSAPLRREPSDQPRGRSIAVLPRGERVTVLEARDSWSRVRTSTGEEGWLGTGVLAPVQETQEGTVLATAWAFDRPDLLAANARRRLEPGTLLFIRKSKDLFTEVDAGPGPSTWILTDRLSTQPADVTAARLLEKARQLDRNGRRAEARDVLALLRSTLPGSPLVPVLAGELGEVPPDGGVVDGAESPSGPGRGAPSPSGPGSLP